MRCEEKSDTAFVEPFDNLWAVGGLETFPPPTLAIECDHSVVSVTFFFFFHFFLDPLCRDKGYAFCLAMEKNLICPLTLFEHLQRWCSYVTLPNIFFTSKFNYLLFSNPTYKTEETGTQTCEELLIANHLDQSL